MRRFLHQAVMRTLEGVLSGYGSKPISNMGVRYLKKDTVKSSMAHQKQILIVEDNELNRTILREILSEHYQVLKAENGQEALDVLDQHKGDVVLILLDMIMPVMDGYAQ